MSRRPNQSKCLNVYLMPSVAFYCFIGGLAPGRTRGAL